MNSDIFNLLKDVVIGVVTFFTIFIITIYASIFFNYLIIQNNFDSTFIYYVYAVIKHILVGFEGIALVAFLFSQTIKFLRELKFLCKDFENE